MNMSPSLSQRLTAICEGHPGAESAITSRLQAASEKDIYLLIEEFRRGADMPGNDGDLQSGLLTMLVDAKNA